MTDIQQRLIRRWVTLGSPRSRFHSCRCWPVHGQSQHRFLDRSFAWVRQIDPSLDQQEQGL